MKTDDDTLRSLDEVRRDTQRLQAKLIRAVQHGQSTRDGEDATGSVTVVLDGDGAACDIGVAADWRQRLRPGELARAVCAADTDAAQRRARATAHALSLLSGADPEPSTGDDELTAAYPQVREARQHATGVPRTLAELTTATWAALDDLDCVAAVPAPVTGVAAAGAVRLRLSQGRVVDCAIDPRWLDRQDPATLAQGLREALSAARAAVTDAQRPAAEFQDRLSGLLCDVRATLAGLAQGSAGSGPGWAQPATRRPA